MKRPSILHGLVAILLAFGATLHAQQNPETPIFDACPEVAALMEAAAWEQALINPVLYTPAEIQDVRSQRLEMLACLESVRFRTILPPWFPRVRDDLELFLAFAPGPDETGLRADLVDLESSEDPAVRSLRRDVGLRPPAGLVFIRYFESRDQMPGAIREAFGSPETRAVTMASRYIAVLNPSATPGESFERTLSHELVHAFLNAGLDWGEEGRRFPAWFHEGTAIHFSGSGRVHFGAEPGGGGFVRIAPTTDYERYRRVFLFLENRLGTAGFHRALRETVARVDANVLLGAAGAGTYAELVEDAERWWRWWPLPAAWVTGSRIWWTAAAALVLMLLGLRFWQRWQPAVPGSSLEVSVNQDLIEAVRMGDLDETTRLLRSGADPNAHDVRDARRWTALRCAVFGAPVEIVELLVDRGARVTPEIRREAGSRQDPEIERVIADAATRQIEVW